MKVTKGELYAAIEVIENVVGGDLLEEMGMLHLNGDLTAREEEMYEALSRAYTISHGFNPAHSCFGSHVKWRSAVHEAQS